MSGCVEQAVAVEKKLCMTGTAWGLLKNSSTEILIAFWLVRHIIYFGVAAALLIFVPESDVGIIIFFVVVHLYKILRFLSDDQPKNETKLEKSDKSEEVAVENNV